MNNSPESQNTEFKSSWHDDYLKWICGFANAVGGMIFIGKNDKGIICDVSGTGTQGNAVERTGSSHLYGSDYPNAGL